MMPPQYDFLLGQGPQSQTQRVFVMAEPTKKMKTTAIEVMREGSIVQSGKYNSLLDFGLDFKALVYAHDASSMELVGVETKTESNASPKEILMSSDYWLSYETSDANAASFNPSLFISVYAIIAAVSFRLVLLICFIYGIENFSDFLRTESSQHPSYSSCFLSIQRHLEES